MIGLDQVGKGMPLAVDFLIVLVAFTGEHHHIVDAGAGDQLGNGVTATGDKGSFGDFFEACTDVIENLAWVFAARVVVGHQHAVGQALDRNETTRKDAAGAILYAAEKATWMAGEAIQALGGMGYINETPTGLLWRDAKLYEIGAGTSEIRRWLIGRELFGETA